MGILSSKEEPKWIYLRSKPGFIKPKGFRFDYSKTLVNKLQDKKTALPRSIALYKRAARQRTSTYF